MTAERPDMLRARVYSVGWLWRATWDGELIPRFFAREADAWLHIYRLKEAGGPETPSHD